MDKVAGEDKRVNYGECDYCGRRGDLDGNSACKECAHEAHRREDFYADRAAGDFDDERPYERKEEDSDE